jgi:hypothetical protein
VSLEATGSYRKLLEAFRSFIDKTCLLGGYKDGSNPPGLTSNLEL